MLANLQRLITLTLVTAACGWLLYFRGSAPFLAVSGFLVIALGYTAFLALEFLLLRAINKSDPAPQASCGELFRAWVGETLTAPRVFCWRQPFRANAIPDNIAAQTVTPSLRGIVFVHGFFCNRGLWTPWLK